MNDSSPAKPVTSQDVQQDLLLAMAAVVPFTASVRSGRLHLRWTSGLCRLFGIAAGKPGWPGGPMFNKWVAPEDAAKLRAAIARLMDYDEPMDVTYYLQAGSSVGCIQVCARRQIQGGKTRLVGVFKDCTAEVSAERHLQASQERLQSVGRLTLLGEVASGLAHELNQPLAAITTFAQAGERLLGMPEPRLEKAKDVFREVSQQALRAGETIRHMRGLIKRRAAQFELLTDDRLMGDFLPLAESMARASQVRLVACIETSGRTVSVDLAQLLQAMMILFQNAVEATRERSVNNPQVIVELTAGVTGVEWAIQDQGPGVGEAVAARLFQPFFSTKDHGTGLGLVSCRNILAAHGSRLSYANLSEGGCRFWFVLPYAQAAASPRLA